VPAVCTDGVKNQDETDIDCGGETCVARCADQQDCLVNDDCQSTHCDNGQTGAGGAGGAVPTAGTCAATQSDGTGCIHDAQCTSDHCTDGYCCNEAACANGCVSCGVSGNLGVCVPNDGAPCGDQTTDACSSPDTCDGTATCQPNHASQGDPCGGTETECDHADTCDGSGTCLDNLETNGTQCNAVCNPGLYRLDYGECQGGTCTGSYLTQCWPFLCPQGNTVCNTSCTTNADCPLAMVCTVGPASCEQCGHEPGGGSCIPASCPGSCIGPACELGCIGGGPPSYCGQSTINIPANNSPAELFCDGFNCSFKTIQCNGPYPCTVHCTDACEGSHIYCSGDGPCRVDCSAPGTPINVTVHCGGNECEIDGDGSCNINIIKGDSCNCHLGLQYGNGPCP